MTEQNFTVTRKSDGTTEPVEIFRTTDFYLASYLHGVGVPFYGIYPKDGQDNCRPNDRKYEFVFIKNDPFFSVTLKKWRSKESEEIKLALMGTTKIKAKIRERKEMDERDWAIRNAQ